MPSLLWHLLLTQIPGNPGRITQNVASGDSHGVWKSSVLFLYHLQSLGREWSLAAQGQDQTPGEYWVLN
jgi:hypothetical protein